MRNFSLFSNFGVTRLCGLWLYYWYWPSQGSGYYQSASSPLLLTISQSLHSGEWGLFCHNFLFSILQPSSPYNNIYLYDSHSVTQWTIRVICIFIKIIILATRSYLSLWGVRRVSMRAEWFGPLGDRVETVGCFIRMETSRCWLITINMIMIIIVSYLVKYWDDDYEDYDYRWMVGWNPSVVSFH